MDHGAIVAAVKSGLTYGQVSVRFGCTRNVVAGIMYREKKRGGAPRKVKSLRALERWQRMTASERASRIANAWAARKALRSPETQRALSGAIERAREDSAER